MGAAPEVSFIVSFKNGENMTAECMRTLFACAAEIPSAEYIFVDDGSTERTGALPDLLTYLSKTFGIRYELSRYSASVGFTLATSEAARRANGTYLLFLNNDAFIQRNALRALRETFLVHANVGVVGGKLINRDDVTGEARTQEAGAIVWKDASGAWFLKNSQLHAGKSNEVNHRLGYLRETDYVSAAFAMVPRKLFLQYNMFDVHFSPGYYEDTDLSFTMRANGHRVLYQPFAHVLHNAHSTYKGDTESLIERNRQHFVSKCALQHPLLIAQSPLATHRSPVSPIRRKVGRQASSAYAAVHRRLRMQSAAEDHVHASGSDAHVLVPHALD